MQKRKILIISVVAIILILAALVSAIHRKESYIIVNENKIKIEIADTDMARYKGLSGRKNLCGECGMLFLFPNEQKRNFVMRDMNFPLDIVWVKDGKIIKIDKNLLPEGTNPSRTYSSDDMVDMVLEVNGGFCEKNVIEEGDSIIYNQLKL